MRRACVMGWPVAHSLSPRLHGYWLKHYGIGGEYIGCEVTPERLEETLRTLGARGFAGCNITIPHKEAAIGWLDELDETARRIGAVNTVVVTDKGGLAGSNSDAYGFIQNLKDHASLEGKKRKAVVLGAGGAARAVVYALVSEGFFEVVVCNRTLARAENMAAHFGTPVAVAWENRHAALEGADLLVNTTSQGLAGAPPLELDWSYLPADALVTDIVYKPLMTSFLQQAAGRGHQVIDGLGMLIHQAVPGFEAWFGVRPEVTPALRAFLLAELGS